MPHPHAAEQTQYPSSSLGEQPYWCPKEADHACEDSPNLAFLGSKQSRRHISAVQPAETTAGRLPRLTERKRALARGWSPTSSSLATVLPRNQQRVVVAKDQLTRRGYKGTAPSQRKSRRAMIGLRESSRHYLRIPYAQCNTCTARPLVPSHAHSDQRIPV